MKNLMAELRFLLLEYFVIYSVVHVTCSAQILPWCRENEVYAPCINKCNTCADRGNNCLQTAECTPGCDCILGHFRNSQGNCVPPILCDGPSPVACRLDEEFKTCGCVRSCYNQGNSIACNMECLTGCFCRGDLVRDKFGNCIKLEDCLPEITGKVKCGVNEEVVNCAKPQTCNTCELKGNCILKSCIPGCDCKQGFYRDRNGICIHKSKCPQNGECKKDEQFYGNMPDCKNTCENYNNPALLCLVEKPGCFCKEGLVKRKDGKCVRPEDCDKGNATCGKNEKLVDCAKPEWCNTCGIRGNCKLSKCESGCDCKEGYYRDDNGVCIDGNHCPENEMCGPDEVHLECGSACPPTCENYGQPVNCTDQCVHGCFCKEGLVRNKDRRCVIPERCAKSTCNADEEHKSCGTSCPDTCDNYGKPRVCTRDCVDGCFCKRGLVRNSDFKCVMPEKCGIKLCNEDEEFKLCGTDCPDTCDNYNLPHVCTKNCVAGCFCKSGLVRNVDTMKCIPPEQCDKIRCGKNAHFSDCASLCPPTCLESDLLCAAVCVDGCVCDDPSQVFDGNGNCIPKSQCPSTKTCGQDEQYYGCIPNCRRTCETYNKEILCSTICIPGCFCKEGLVKRIDGKCVKPKECSDVPKCPTIECGKNEKYSTCVIRCNDCETKGNCEFLECNEGCDCIENHYRNEKGICIPESQCPKKEECPENQEYYRCKPTCKHTCRTYNVTRPICLKICRSGCFCKKGLVMTKDRKCVEPKDCPKKCRRNEKYSTCVNPCNNCEIKGKCNFLVCNKGCDCKEGYYRNDKGICIPEAQCRIKIPVCPRIACPQTCRFVNEKPCPRCVCEQEGKVPVNKKVQ